MRYKEPSFFLFSSHKHLSSWNKIEDVSRELKPSHLNWPRIRNRNSLATTQCTGRWLTCSLYAEMYSIKWQTSYVRILLCNAVHWNEIQKNKGHCRRCLQSQNSSPAKVLKLWSLRCMELSVCLIIHVCPGRYVPYLLHLPLHNSHQMLLQTKDRKMLFNLNSTHQEWF